MYTSQYKNSARDLPLQPGQCFTKAMYLLHLGQRHSHHPLACFQLALDSFDRPVRRYLKNRVREIVDS